MINTMYTCMGRRTALTLSVQLVDHGFEPEPCRQAGRVDAVLPLITVITAHETWIRSPGRRGRVWEVLWCSARPVAGSYITWSSPSGRLLSNKRGRRRKRHAHLHQCKAYIYIIPRLPYRECI